MDSTAIRGFRKLCFATLMAVYFLVLVGGIVRTTGSGMGCPDWPRCFGKWSPPSSVNQLPENYKEVYAASREKKNLKFVKYLRTFGFNATADSILNDKSIQTETDFNFTKAWIEYANRLVGVAVGFFIIALFYSSLKFRKTFSALFYLSLATLTGVIFQGWFGSIVVSTNLTSWTITLHMFLALAIIAMLIKLLTLTSHYEVSQSAKHPTTLLVLCMAFLLLQILFGTQVRSAIDQLASQLPRSEWIEAIGMRFLLHRSFSLAVLILHVVLVLKMGKIVASKALPRALIILILGTLLTGVGMAWLAVPAVLQPLHLALATGTFGVQLYLFFEWRKPQQPVITN